MSSGDDTGERNPFAPPPADAPDQPWQPRSPWTGEGQDGTGGQSGERPQLPPPWGSGQGDGRPGQRPPAPQPPRLDPANPAHRRARNAALAGPFALVCLFAGFHWIALLVGVLGIVWGIGALRSPRPAAAAAAPAGQSGPVSPVGPVGPVPGAAAPNPLTPAALAGILTGAMTIVVATSVIGLGYYYRDYVTCVQDSLTAVGAENCDRYAPQWYVDFTGNTE
ncbi:hypothetical protein BX285_1853 [Streptomyces sp. 1114.5]|uniref:hypothetical protein n=1 Tax=Streptomyces sp. 1114.5 TaxID=1938830 RepID=UPI000EB0605D|nr:hypothetical protein [Streptomyces sp. 1114.5]RKT17476.1 hypothetical protein BX285_1853 [Streptomyces sp. 1114.5]